MLLYVGFIWNNLFRKKDEIFVWFLLHSITMSISIITMYLYYIVITIELLTLLLFQNQIH